MPTRADETYKPQMIIWHNLLAIWLWRYFISALEAIGIPGIVSVLGLILYYIPTYFLWVTGFFFLMLVTKKTGDTKTYVSLICLVCSDCQTAMLSHDAEGQYLVC